MTTADVPAALWSAGIVATGAMIAVLVLRRPLRRWFGSGVAYLAWAVVPITVAAFFWPSRANGVLHGVVVHLRSMASAAIATAEPLRQMASPNLASWQLVWLTGTIALAIVFAAQHWSFLRALGTLSPHPNDARIRVSGVDRLGPMSLGLLRPMIVVPSDFEIRYSALERELVIAHESVHGRRGDALANAAWALAQCVFWFNPVVHLSARRFRVDQELACDDAVLRRHPGARRVYAEAILKAQAAWQSTPFCIHWSTYPLKERILNLKHPRTSTHRRAAGHALVAALSCCAMYGAWAVQAASIAPDAGPSYDMTMTIKVEDRMMTPRLLLQAGQTATVSFDDTLPKWSVQLTVKPVGSSVMVNSTIKRGDDIVGEPALLLKPGQDASVHVSADASHPAVDLSVGITVAVAQ